MRKNSKTKSLFLTSLTVFMLLYMTVNCTSSKFNSDQNSDRSGEEKIILQVWTDVSSTSYPYGKYLSIRLYQNGTAEFDFFAPKKPDEIITRLKLERKEAKLPQEDFDKLISLLSKSDLLSAKESYEPRRLSPMSIDSSVKKSITFKIEGGNKTILLKEDDDHLYLDDPPSYITAKQNPYPPSLIELLKSVERINKKLREQIDPKSQ